MPAVRLTVCGAAPLPEPSADGASPNASAVGSPIPAAASACHTPNAKLGRWGKPRAPEPVPRLRPTGARESASGPCARSATARNGGKPSACRGEYWETAWSSSVLLVSASERPTLATTARSSHAGLPKGHRRLQAWSGRLSATRPSKGLSSPRGGPPDT